MDWVNNEGRCQNKNKATLGNVMRGIDAKLKVVFNRWLVFMHLKNFCSHQLTRKHGFHSFIIFVEYLLRVRYSSRIWGYSYKYVRSYLCSCGASKVSGEGPRGFVKRMCTTVFLNLLWCLHEHLHYIACNLCIWKQMCVQRGWEGNIWHRNENQSFLIILTL